MKNISLVLNAVLLAAVLFLYIKVFSGNKQVKTTESQPVKNDDAPSRIPVAFVELDSLNDNITYIKDRRVELDA